jgi:RNA polymerase sigma-70 factor (ECF subfamily)
MVEFPLVERIASSDADLIHAWPQNSQEAEAELCRRMAPRVRLYGLRHLRDEQAAADLTQEVLLIMLEALREGRVRRPEKLASFVLGTCRMVVLDMRRGASRRVKLLERYAREAPAWVPEPVRALDGRRLADCLSKLAERERSIVVMGFYDERTSEEVASSFGLSTANVRQIRHRALLKLRSCMGGGPA